MITVMCKCNSGGGPYALATAFYLPDRVRGVLLLSPASNSSEPSILDTVLAACLGNLCMQRHESPKFSGPRRVAGLMDEQQRQEWSSAGNPSSLLRRLRSATGPAPWLLYLLARISETGFGGRLLYHRVLKPTAGERSNLCNTFACPWDRDGPGPWHVTFLGHACACCRAWVCLQLGWGALCGS